MNNALYASEFLTHGRFSAINIIYHDSRLSFDEQSPPRPPRLTLASSTITTKHSASPISPTLPSNFDAQLPPSFLDEVIQTETSYVPLPKSTTITYYTVPAYHLYATADAMTPPPPPPPSATRSGGTRTQTTTLQAGDTDPQLTHLTQRYVTLRLRGVSTDPTTTTTAPSAADGDGGINGGRRRRRIHWADDVVNNEGMNRKKSKGMFYVYIDHFIFAISAYTLASSRQRKGYYL